MCHSFNCNKNTFQFSKFLSDNDHSSITLLNYSFQFLFNSHNIAIIALDSPNKKIIAQFQHIFDPWDSPCAFHYLINYFKQLESKNLLNIINKIDSLSTLTQIDYQKTPILYFSLTVTHKFTMDVLNWTINYFLQLVRHHYVNRIEKLLQFAIVLIP